MKKITNLTITFNETNVMIDDYNDFNMNDYGPKTHQQLQEAMPRDYQTNKNEISVQITSKNEISVQINEVFDAQEAFDIINNDSEIISKIKRVMPEDYDLIKNELKYPHLISYGTPQLTMCQWTIISEVNDKGITIKITNFN